MRWYSDEDTLDWVKVGRGGGNSGGHFRTSKLFMARQTKRGYGAERIRVDPTMPQVAVVLGHTQRRDIGIVARETHRERLRAQSNYIDRSAARADGFDRD